MTAAIHHGENYKDNLFTHRDTDVKALKTLFHITQKLILNQMHEVRRASTIEWQHIHWMRSILLYDKEMKLSKT